MAVCYRTYVEYIRLFLSSSERLDNHLARDIVVVFPVRLAAVDGITSFL